MSPHLHISECAGAVCVKKQKKLEWAVVQGGRLFSYSNVFEMCPGHDCPTLTMWQKNVIQVVFTASL